MRKLFGKGNEKQKLKLKKVTEKFEEIEEKRE